MAFGSAAVKHAPTSPQRQSPEPATTASCFNATSCMELSASLRLADGSDGKDRACCLEPSAGITFIVAIRAVRLLRISYCVCQCVCARRPATVTAAIMSELLCDQWQSKHLLALVLQWAHFVKRKCIRDDCLLRLAARCVRRTASAAIRNWMYECRFRLSKCSDFCTSCVSGRNFR